MIDFEKERTFNKVLSTSIGDGRSGIFNQLFPSINGETGYVATANSDIKMIHLANGKTFEGTGPILFLVGGVDAEKKGHHHNPVPH
jgi:hypothetical protein